MLSCLSRLLIFLAAVQILGGHWAALQSIAWARMVADYAQGESLVAAIEKTFDGDHPCDLCKQVASGRAQEQKLPVAKSIVKLDAVLMAKVSVPAPRIVDLEYSVFAPTAVERGSAPQSPPPRRA